MLGGDELNDGITEKLQTLVIERVVLALERNTRVSQDSASKRVFRNL